eukprot:jgi/Tetstr1/422436/TSEL_013274.t1
MSNELWDYGGVGDEDDEMEADEGGDGSDGEACGDAGGNDAASEQAGEDAPTANENAPTDSLDPESDFPLVDNNAGVQTLVGPLGCVYGCAQAGHAGGDLELMVRNGALELSLFRYEERLGKQRDYDLKSKLMEEPVRSAKTASHVETIEALKALAINRDFPTDMRSLSHRLLDTPVYAVSYSRAGLGLTM